MDVLPLLLGAALNGAVTWGVVRTTLAYLRRDVDRAHARIERVERVVFVPAAGLAPVRGEP